MLSAEMNDRIARVGPGTPCGELMRRYWIPFLPTAKLDEDGVQKVRLLGEDLTVYRDTSGNLGLIGDRCLHRAVDLQWGIPDTNGLRCPYHGWLFGADGRCLDTPLEAVESTFKDKLRIKAYPVRELGGLLFAYMGPLPAPVLPPWDLYVWPNVVRQIGTVTLNCNWLQCHENTGDPLHGVYLHGHLFKYALEKMGASPERVATESRAGINAFIKNGVGVKGLYANPTQYGMEKGVVYAKELGADRDYRSRHSTVIFPFYTQVGVAGSPRSEFQIRVPIDDTHTYHITYTSYAAPPGLEAPHQDTVPWYEVPIYDEAGKRILDSITNGDMIAWWSQGPLTDRSKEKLGRTDVPVIFLRRQLNEQITLVEQGKDPMNVFRNAAAMPDILHGSGVPPADWTAEDWVQRQAGSATTSGADWVQRQAAPGRTSSNAAFRMHKEGALRDTDRYGPAIPLIAELHRRIEEAQLAGTAAVEAGPL